jgi:hypothetical protein
MIEVLDQWKVIDAPEWLIEAPRMQKRWFGSIESLCNMYVWLIKDIRKILEKIDFFIHFSINIQQNVNKMHIFKEFHGKTMEECFWELQSDGLCFRTIRKHIRDDCGVRKHRILHAKRFKYSPKPLKFSSKPLKYETKPLKFGSRWLKFWINGRSLMLQNAWLKLQGCRKDVTSIDSQLANLSERYWEKTVFYQKKVYFFNTISITCIFSKDFMEKPWKNASGSFRVMVYAFS